MEALIKWTGSKRHQAEMIVDKFTKEVGTYYEMFLGGGSVLGEYLSRLVAPGSQYTCQKIVCCDVNEDLIDIWKLVVEDPQALVDSYRELWEAYNSCTAIDMREVHEWRKHQYSIVRDEYNALVSGGSHAMRRTLLFNWLTRNSFNGLVRISKDGRFTTSCHFSRRGIDPDKFAKIVTEWHGMLTKVDITFRACDFMECIPACGFSTNDVIYCDPPYFGAKGMYDYDGFDASPMFSMIYCAECTCILSYNGCGTTSDLQRDLFDEIHVVQAGLSSFRRMHRNIVEVEDSLCVKHAPSA